MYLHGFSRYADRTAFVPVEFKRRLRDCLGSFPTTGCTVLHWIMEHAEPASIFVMGFADRRQDRDHYHEQYARAAFDHRSHNLNREAMLFWRTVKPNVTTTLRKVINLHIRDGNTGDMKSAPANYFKLPAFKRDLRSSSAGVAGANLILGGGAILHRGWDSTIAKMIDAAKH